MECSTRARWRHRRALRRRKRWTRGWSFRQPFSSGQACCQNTDLGCRVDGRIEILVFGVHVACLLFRKRKGRSKPASRVPAPSKGLGKARPEGFNGPTRANPGVIAVPWGKTCSFVPVEKDGVDENLSLVIRTPQIRVGGKEVYRRIGRIVWMDVASAATRVQLKHTRGLKRPTARIYIWSIKIASLPPTVDPQSVDSINIRLQSTTFLSSSDNRGCIGFVESPCNTITRHFEVVIITFPCLERTKKGCRTVMRQGASQRPMKNEVCFGQLFPSRILTNR